jgi:Metallo-beta-lactamase superfamily
MMDVHRLHLTDVTPAPHLPWARPTFPVFSYLVLHPTSPILIDTGVGVGNAFINALYSPVHYDLDEALARHGVSVDDIAIVITSHLVARHFRMGNAREQGSDSEAGPAYRSRQYQYKDAYSIGCVFVCGRKAFWNVGFWLMSDRVGRVWWGLGT